MIEARANFRWKEKARGALCLAATLTLSCALGDHDGNGIITSDTGALETRFSASTKSSSIALSQDGRFALVANVDANSASLVEVRGEGGEDTLRLVAEIGVGEEPRFVAMAPDGNTGYVGSSLGNVTVLDLSGKAQGLIRVSNTILLRGELRGMALTPNGTQLYVANYSEGVVHRINTLTNALVSTIPTGIHPYALAITNDQDGDDLDETVFVSEFFGEPVPGREGFDDGRLGVIYSIPTSGDTARKLTVAPLADCGFTADRTAFGNTVFKAPPGTPNPAATPQGCFPNQIHSLLTRGDRVWATSIAGEPEPPVAFTTNIQALVSVLDRNTGAEVTTESENLNNLVKVETRPVFATGKTDRLFMGDLVDLAANDEGTVFLALSRSGNFVVRATRDDSGRLTFNNSATTPAIRIKTGWLPTSVVINPRGDRAYTYNEGGFSITSIDLTTNSVIRRNTPTATIPSPGTFQHGILWGKLAFFTSLGTPKETPNETLRSLNMREFDPTSVRDAATGKGPASDNGWSSCASCHPGGLSDNITWIFPDGPRQTIPLDATFSKTNPLDRRAENWSAVRSSITEFNNNSRAVQGGLGFADIPALVYNHGFTEGVSEALDDMTLWVQTVRTLRAPASAGPVSRTVFDQNCASCHGGSKWTKSTVLWKDDPTFPSNPSAATVQPFDPGVIVANDSVAMAPRDSIAAYKGDTNGNGMLDAGDETLSILDDVDTFHPGPLTIEVRGLGALGQEANGAAGFNVPSLLGTTYTAPYFHDGSARTLEEVFAKHALGIGTIATELSDAQRAELTAFLRSIDGRTVPVDSDADRFHFLLGP